jgi:hypothetical protein
MNFQPKNPLGSRKTLKEKIRKKRNEASARRIHGSNVHPEIYCPIRLQSFCLCFNFDSLLEHNWKIEKRKERKVD